MRAIWWRCLVGVLEAPFENVKEYRKDAIEAKLENVLENCHKTSYTNAPQIANLKTKAMHKLEVI